MENQNTPAGSPPDNNLVWAIISIICCWPLGIFAIIKSTKVKSLWLEGDHAGAEKAAADTKKFAMIGIGIGAVGGILYAILMALGVASGGGF